MATHDYIISNASGAAVRADLNNALAAIATNNSSATEPTTTYAYQWWADTGSSPTVMKLRNATNSGWITLFQLDGEWTVVPFENGTAAAPSIYFKDSGTDTGIYSPGADQVAITTGGTGRLFVTSSGSVGIGTSSVGDTLHVKGSSTYGGVIVDNSAATGGGAFRAYRNGVQKAIFCADSWVTGTSSDDAAIYADAGGGIKFYTNNSSTAKAVLTSGGSLGIGTTSPDAQSQLHIVGSGYQPLFVNTTAAGGGGAAFFRSGTQALYVGTGGSSWLSGSSTADGLIRSEANLVFATGGNNQRAQIDSSGRLLVGTSSAFTSSTGNAPYGKFATVGATNDATAQGIISLGKGAAASSNINGATLGEIYFTDNAGNPFGVIAGWADGATGANDYPGRLVFSTTADGASSPTQRFLISNGGFINCPGFYNRTTATAANMLVDAGGDVYRSTSSAKYKTDIETIQDSYADALLQCRPVWYRSTCPDDNPNWGWWGFIAEEVAEIDPRLVHWKTVEITYDEKGAAVHTPCEPEPEGVQYDRFVPHLLNLIKRQQQAIETLEAEVGALKAQ